MDGRIMPSGNRRAVARTEAAELAEFAPQAMREYLAPHVPEYCDSLLEAMRTPTLPGAAGEVRSNPAYRTALSLFPQILKAIGAQGDLLEALLARLAMPSEASLASAAELYKAVQGQDVHEIYRECKRMVEFYEGPNGPGRES